MSATSDLEHPLTAYDRVRYPSLVFAQTHPERLGILARFAGLDPVRPEEARVLEIGGGDCLNTIAFATTYPTSRVCGFDLSRAAIADGQALVTRAGLTNVELVEEDIVRAVERYGPRSFDYVIAHGVYAWLPDPVREATMALIGHVLSDRGVAYVSYNVSAGGHIRRFLREMLLEVLRGVDDPDQRLAQALAWLNAYSQEKDLDVPAVKALKFYARQLLDKPGAVLLHDELGDCYFPQSLRGVVDQAAANGLRYLTDASAKFDGFNSNNEQGASNDDEAIIRRNQLDDFGSARFFRESLLVRAEAKVERDLRVEHLHGLLVSTRLQLNDEGALVHGKEKVRLADERLTKAWSDLGASYPARIPVEEIATNYNELRALLHMYAPSCVDLHFARTPFCTEVGERPCSSPLVRAQIQLGLGDVATLDHNTIRVSQPELRELLLAADGTRTIDEIGQMGIAIPADEVRGALNHAATLALMVC